MTALARQIGRFITRFTGASVAELKAVYRPRAVTTPDFAKLRKEAMERFPKTRAHLAQ